MIFASLAALSIITELGIKEVDVSTIKVEVDLWLGENEKTYIWLAHQLSIGVCELRREIEKPLSQSELSNEIIELLGIEL